MSVSRYLILYQIKRINAFYSLFLHNKRDKIPNDVYLCTIPMNLNLDWNDIHYFLLLVENQTLTATANVLNVEHSTVSRRIERLEKELNVHLFNRIHKRYLLTDDGKRLYTEAKKLQFNVRQIAQTAQDSRQAMTEEI